METPTYVCKYLREKVFSILSTDIVVSGKVINHERGAGIPIVAKFHSSNSSRKESLCSKNIAIGFSDGRVSIMNIETASFTFCAPFCDTPTSLISLAWVPVPQSVWQSILARSCLSFTFQRW